MPDVEALVRQISDLRRQLDRTAQIVVAKDNDLKPLDKDKDKLKQILTRLRQRMRQVGATLFREGG